MKIRGEYKWMAKIKHLCPELYLFFLIQCNIKSHVGVFMYVGWSVKEEILTVDVKVH
jgi:hypothetical protein